MRFLLTVVAFLGFLQLAQAQEIGIRFGEGANNVALDGVFALGEFNRVHGNVNFGSGVGIDLLWDFLYRPVSDSGLNWYVGVGPSLVINDPFFFGVAGEIGLEYRFDFPLSLSIDWRPTLWIVSDTDFRADFFGLNLRYIIN